MPSKNGFGNGRTPMTKKVGYGSAMHYKNPIKFSWAQSEGENDSKNKRRGFPTPAEMHNAAMIKFNSKLPEGDRRRMKVK
tara:strand:+ start:158 stop:397 length:240 start_codon:yes stop_codon:yes gene_type:complete